MTNSDNFMDPSMLFKDNLRGERCANTKACFNLLRDELLYPLIRIADNKKVVRVSINDVTFFYWGSENRWCVAKFREAKNVWKPVVTPRDFYDKALSFTRGTIPTSEAQIKFMDSLVNQTGSDVNPEAYEYRKIASAEINRLLQIKANQPKPQSTGDRMFGKFLRDANMSGLEFDEGVGCK